VVKSLRFRCLSDGSLPTLSPILHLTQLEGLEEVGFGINSLKKLDDCVDPTLATINNHRVQKVTFDTKHSYHPTNIMSQIDLASWEKLENRFIAGAHALRVGTGQTLEVVFNVLYQGYSQVELGETFLRGCREDGKVIVKFGPRIDASTASYFA
jgi:hypothetical protein